MSTLLTAIEARILGSLMEKETTTPESYPLSLNALLAAANQKSSREPVMQLTENEARGAVRSLEDKDLVSVDHGSRVERFENRARTVFNLRRDETALLCLLLLRGPQTPGELRGRAERLFAFDEVQPVLAALERMGEAVTPHEGGVVRQPLVAALPRQPGSREQRYTHLLCGTPDAAEPVRRAPAPNISVSAAGGTVESLAAQLSLLGAEVAGLRARVTALEAALAARE